MNHDTFRIGDLDGPPTTVDAGGWAAAGGSIGLVDRLFASVWSRKAYHLVAGGGLAASILILGIPWFTLLCLGWLLVFGIVGHRISTAVLGLLVVAVLSKSVATTLGTAVVFVVGDGLAPLAGTLFGRMRLPWHEGKSLAGSLAFLVGATSALLAVLPHVVACSRPALALLAFLPSLAGCLVESSPCMLVRDIRDGLPDDNLLVILSSGMVLHWLMGMLQAGVLP